jgi:hypothetical protein
MSSQFILVSTSCFSRTKVKISHHSYYTYDLNPTKDKRKKNAYWESELLAFPEPNTGNSIIIVFTEYSHAAKCVFAQLFQSLEHTFFIIDKSILIKLNDLSSV